MKIAEELEYLSVAETKAKLSEKLRRVQQNNRRFGIASHGKPKAVIVSYQDYLKLRSLEQNAATLTKDADVNKVRQTQVVEYVSSRFNEDILTRKGQKGYKNEYVKK